MEAVELQRYDEWLARHLDELVAQYAGRVIAIYRDEVIIVGDNEGDVYRRIQKAGLESMPLVFRVPTEDDLQSIL